jgi:hypothetical protein
MVTVTLPNLRYCFLFLKQTTIPLYPLPFTSIMSLSHAILATLSNGCYSGYDLSKQFAGSVGFFWHATQQQIYRELTKLEAQGYLSAEVVITQVASYPIDLL